MTIPDLASSAGWIVAGLLAVVGAFNLQARQRRKDDDVTASNLINNLKTTVDLQEKEIHSLRNREVSQGREIAHLQGQVSILTDILQGKDPAMQSFLDTSPKIIETLNSNSELAKQNVASIAKLTESIVQFIEVVGPFIVHSASEKKEVKGVK